MTNIIPFQEMESMADAIAKSKLFGMQTKEQVLALMAVAQAEGLHPAMAARDYHIIQGRPSLKADAMMARFQLAGGKVDWKEYTDDKVTGVFTHPSGGSITLSWTIDQAKKIGLVRQGSGWEKYPRAMLRARVISEGIRTVYPGCVVGTYTPEEIQDFDPVEKDMGDVEVVVDNLKQELETEPVDNSDDLIPLNLPNSDKPYAMYKTWDEWIEGYIDLYRKLWNSPKYDDEERYKKLEDLNDVNLYIKKKMDAVVRVSMTRKIAEIRGENHG